MIYFSKIKRKNGEVKIEYYYRDEVGNGFRESALISYDEPLPEFIEALDAFKGDVETICELPDGYMDSATIQSVSLSIKNSVLFATITALRPLDTALSPLTINTPKLPSVSRHGPEMPPGMEDRVMELQEQARRYLNGERAQAQGRLPIDAE